jgi:hypothetical protein
VKGKLSVMLLTGAMAAGSVWASTEAECRHETEEPAKIVRKTVRVPHYATKTDRQIAQTVFHAARLPKTAKLEQAKKTPAKTKPTRQPTAKSKSRAR